MDTVGIRFNNDDVALFQCLITKPFYTILKKTSNIAINTESTTQGDQLAMAISEQLRPGSVLKTVNHIHSKRNGK